MRWVLVVVLLGFISCSKAVRVRVRFELPTGTLDPAKLHLRGLVACRGPAQKAVPPGRESDPYPQDLQGARPLEEALHYELVDGTLAAAYPGGRCDLTITAFYDSNGDGVLGLGDFVDQLEGVELHDRGLCLGNLTDVGTRTLVAWKP